MSKFVEEIYKDIKENPEKWIPVQGIHTCSGLQKDDIKIVSCGQPKMLSILDVKIKDRVVNCSYMDKWNLEGIVAWWYKNCSVSDILKAKD